MASVSPVVIRDHDDFGSNSIQDRERDRFQSLRARLRPEPLARSGIVLRAICFKVLGRAGRGNPAQCPISIADPRNSVAPEVISIPGDSKFSFAQNVAGMWLKYGARPEMPCFIGL
jgi:hypothetical protein